MATIREQAERILADNGWVRDTQARSLKHRVWFRPGRDGKWYLGRGGSIRFGRNFAGSTPYDLAALRVFAGPAIVVRAV